MRCLSMFGAVSLVEESCSSTNDVFGLGLNTIALTAPFVFVAIVFGKAGSPNKAARFKCWLCVAGIACAPEKQSIRGGPWSSDASFASALRFPKVIKRDGARPTNDDPLLRLWLLP